MLRIINFFPFNESFHVFDHIVETNLVLFLGGGGGRRSILIYIRTKLILYAVLKKILENEYRDTRYKIRKFSLSSY